MAKLEIIRTYTLKEPVQYGSETITELNFQKPRGKHLRGLTIKTAGDGGVIFSLGDMMDLAGRLATVAPSVISELGADDVMEVMGIVGGFIGAGPETGKTP